MPPLPPQPKDHEISSSDNKKTATKLPAPEHGVKCPRCDSPNTKFCYYNNYSLNQPRHFCKTCRRYWTNGGALRNVPIGGGCRKNKKVKTSSFSSSAWDSVNKDSSAVSSLAGLRFFPNNSPSLEFQLGGLPLFPASRGHHTHHQQQQQSSFSTAYNQFSSIGGLSNVSSLQLDPSGSLNYPFCSSNGGSGFISAGGAGASASAMGSTIQGMNSMNVNTSLASSIESLSSINQDLHFKLQQQRLATMFGGGGENVNQREGSSSVSVSESQVQLENENHTLKPQPLLFQNLEISKPEMFQNGNYRKEGQSGDPPMEWFFGNSNYSSVTPATSTTTNGLDNANNNWSSGVHAWGDVQQPYNALP